MAILYPASLANQVVEVGTRHCHQTLLIHIIRCPHPLISYESTACTYVHSWRQLVTDMLMYNDNAYMDVDKIRILRRESMDPNCTTVLIIKLDMFSSKSLWQSIISYDYCKAGLWNIVKSSSTLSINTPVPLPFHSIHSLFTRSRVRSSLHDRPRFLSVLILAHRKDHRHYAHGL